jgi:hypothetical protein
MHTLQLLKHKTHNMKLRTLLIGSILASSLASHGQIRTCRAAENLARMKAQDPTLQQRLDEQEAHTAHFISSNGMNEKIQVTIPVVIHVLYNSASQNISDAQIQSQLTVLNRDFRKLNSDVANVPAAFSSLAADAEINFCLATVSPTGAATTGINRVQTTKTIFDAGLDDCKSSSTGGANAWNRNNYLNIWVVPAKMEVKLESWVTLNFQILEQQRLMESLLRTTISEQLELLKLHTMVDEQLRMRLDIG